MTLHAVKRLVCRHLFMALPLLLLLSTLGGCWFFIGDPSVYTGLEAYAPRQSKGESIRLLDETMTATGFTRIKGFSASGQQTDEVRTADEIRIAYGLPGGRAGIDATLADYKSGSTMCVSFRAFPASEFEPEDKAAIAQLRAALIERFGDRNVAAVPCYGRTPNWPG